ncbi:MAG: 4-oxalocrotonate tautomerase family protein [Methanobrevibacter sp.]|jgi:4-oxalocrotonate tautomerase|nr:4-oxalocrotonate tautomerase family protein [Candidatus Methanoflexus mossambicus]
MPIIIVEGNHLDKDKKREYIAKLTEITANTYNLPKTSVSIILREINSDNIGVAGEMLSDIIDKH